LDPLKPDPMKPGPPEPGAPEPGPREPRPRSVPLHDPLDVLVEATSGPQPGRRLFHAVNGLLIWAVLRYSGIETETAIVVLGVLFALALAGDLVRLRNPRLNLLFFRTFSYFASPRERRGMASSTWYLAGIVFALLLFPRPFAESGVLVLALADPAASWFGRRYGRRRFGTGSALGSAVFWLVAAGILWPLVGAGPALVAATAGALAEALPWRIDDNLSVPLVTAAALTLSSAVLG